MKEHIGDILAARATGLFEGMAKGFDMKGERWKRLDDEQKEGSQDNVGIAYRFRMGLHTFSCCNLDGSTLLPGP